MKRQLPAVGLMLLAMIGANSATATRVAAEGSRPARGVPGPNVVVIVSDDQRAGTLWAMPNVRAKLMDHGVTFRDAFVVNSLCCPSRASILTGQYSHNTGVYNDVPPYAIDAFDPGSTIATWLQAHGYQTSLVGKYLNWYRTTSIPPGWSDWHGLHTGGEAGSYYNYSINDNGTIVAHGHALGDYSGSVFIRDANTFIRDATQPFFLYLAPSAPHGPALSLPQDAHAFAHLPPWRPPNYDERNVSDKPAWVQALRRYSAGRSHRLDRFRISQYRSLLTLDREIGTLIDTLKAEGTLHDTMIVFTSDNGYVWGEHRFKGKLAPYESSIRVPMVIRYDPLTAGGTLSTRMVANIDIAPTIAGAAGVAAPGADGTSLLPLLINPAAKRWRSDLLIEHYNNEMPSYCAIRAEDSLYVVYATGEEEYYDLSADPWEMLNLAGVPSAAAQIDAARQRVKQLCSPPPPDMTLPF